jgi:cysteine desulfurase/selenocysteine lyase
MTPVERFSAAFESLPGLTHLNNAGLSPINREAAQVMHSWIERYRTEGMFCNDAYLEAVSVARQDLATFLGARPSQIAFFQSVANAVSQIAFHIGLRPGDEVVMWDQEYGSHLYPWQAACQRTGAELRLVPSGDQLSTPAERLIASVNERTRVIAISWVQFQTGAVCDLEKIVRAIQGRPIRLVVDAFQGLGILPFSFADSGVDALVAGSHKWMTSAVGVGYLCLKEDFAASLAPHNVGS